MKKFLCACLALISPPAHASFSGKSSAEIQWTDENAKMTTNNTEFRFANFSEDVADPKTKKLRLQNNLRLFEIHKKETTYTGRDTMGADLEVIAYDGATSKRLWTLKDNADGFALKKDQYVATTFLGGDCTTSFRVHNIKTGKPLFSYSPIDRNSEMPVILRAGAFKPEVFRFFAYHDSNWPCRDRFKMDNLPKGTVLGGVLTYATPEKVIQKIGVVYVVDDPSEDPDSFELQYKDAPPVSFSYRGPNKEHEYEYWWRKVDNDPHSFETDGASIFSGIKARLKWGQETMEIPIEGDRLQISKAKLGKHYNKLIEISEKDWDKF